MKSKHLKLIFILVILLVIAFSVYSYMSDGLIKILFSQNPELLESYINSRGPLAPIIMILIVILEVVLAPIPALILYTVAGIVFGTWYGGLLVLLGNVIGAIIAFSIARYLARSYISHKIEGKLKKKFDHATQKYGPFSIFLLRINPLTSSDAFSYLAGISNMKLSSFTLATTLGLAPLIFIQTYLGSDLIKNNPFLFKLFLILSIAYLSIFIFLIFRAISKKSPSDKKH